MKLNYYLLLIVVVCLNSCISTIGTTYFNDIKNQDVISISNKQELTIHKNNSLNIVISSKDPLATIPSSLNFNTDDKECLNLAFQQQTYTPSNIQSLSAYVNDYGCIIIPLLGEIKVEGLKISELSYLIKEQLTPYIKDPIVSIKIQNYKITILGEVNKPGTYTIKDGQINILEAIGLAEDITKYGQRNNILLIRNTENEKLKFIKLDLTQKETITSPYFYLQPNDILYIEPTKNNKNNKNNKQ